MIDFVRKQVWTIRDCILARAGKVSCTTNFWKMPKELCGSEKAIVDPDSSLRVALQLRRIIGVELPNSLFFILDDDRGTRSHVSE